MHWGFDQQSIVTSWMNFGYIPTILWSIAWKGLALWHAAKRNEKWWFIGMLVINTVGILEICYLVFVVRLFQGVTIKPTTTKPTKKKRSS